VNPQCPICGAVIYATAPPFFTMDPPQWLMILLVRHVLKKHPEWLEAPDGT